ncbi:MAG: hypothetical protein U7127_03890 [Phormidium sp.]
MGEDLADNLDFDDLNSFPVRLGVFFSTVSTEDTRIFDKSDRTLSTIAIAHQKQDLAFMK